MSNSSIFISLILGCNRWAWMSRCKTSCRAWLKLCVEPMAKSSKKIIKKLWKGSWLRRKEWTCLTNTLTMSWEKINKKFKIRMLTNSSMKWLMSKLQNKRRKSKKIWWISTSTKTTFMICDSIITFVCMLKLDEVINLESPAKLLIPTAPYDSFLVRFCLKFTILLLKSSSLPFWCFVGLLTSD